MLKQTALTRPASARSPLARPPQRAHLTIRASTGRPVHGHNISVGGPVDGQKFDYIIAGGGTAGCVLANKLTADGTTSVLMLEAGGDGEALEVAVPAGIVRLFGNPVMDWGLKSIMQKQLNTRELYLARGKLLGGSSCTNATLYHRGAPQDYDGWGLDGWRAQDVLEWFQKEEENAKGGGTMHVEWPRYQSKLHDMFFETAAAVGIPANPDFNDWSRSQAGYGEFQVTQKKGERADAYRQYLKPALKRGNLKVVQGARTTKVQMERSSGGLRACGVDFNVGGGGEFGQSFTAELAPGGEVLMCTGAVHTPQLLMLSGVGPSQHLQEHGIQVQVDSPAVGTNLQDHPACLSCFTMRPELPSDLSMSGQIYNEKGNLKPSAVLNYVLRRRGPLTSTGCDHGAFVATGGHSASQPDLQIRLAPICSLEPDGVSSYIKFGLMKEQGQTWPNGFTLQLLAARAKSQGSVGLRSSDPFLPPAVDANYFSDPADMATLIAGLRLTRQMAAVEPMASYIEGERFPGSNLQTDAELEEYVRKTVHSGNALTGTARMGTSLEGGAVVSSHDLKVFGVEGLRVVDASVFPTIPGGQTGAPTVMVAERAAALLAHSRRAQRVAVRA